MGVGCIVAVANAIKKNDLFTAIIYLPFGVIMIAGGGMVLLWLISELPRKVVFIGISVAVIGGVAYWVKHSKLSIADIWKNSTPVLWQSIKVFAKMLLGLALLVGVVSLGCGGVVRFFWKHRRYYLIGVCAYFCAERSFFNKTQN
jgi:uncharacterized membrane protein HdeD (DUF308 family)